MAAAEAQAECTVALWEVQEAVSAALQAALEVASVAASEDNIKAYIQNRAVLESAARLFVYKLYFR